jgi:hypothetical protein
MWKLFKKKDKSKKEFIFEYKWHTLGFNTIICAKDKPSAIKKFTDREIFTHIISIKEVI